MCPVPNFSVQFRRAPPPRKAIVLAPLHVELFNGKDDEEHLETKVGPNGKPYNLKIIDVLNLIKARQGFEQKRLEHKPHG